MSSRASWGMAFGALSVSSSAVVIGLSGASPGTASFYRLWHGVDLSPGWPTLGRLLLVAVCGQVLGWLLVAVSAPHLSSHAGAVLLLLTPVGAVVLGALVLGERPALPQLLGGALILAAAYFVAAHDRAGTPTRTPP